jgi:hypothetical protein
MRAVDCEDLKLLAIYISYPAGNICGLPIGWIHDRVSINRQARLARRKLIERTEFEPGLVSLSPPANHGRKYVANDWHSQDRPDGRIKEDSELHQHGPSRKSIR